MTMEHKIRAIMKATGWKQQKVAEVFDVSQSTVNRWLGGAEPEGHRRDAINATFSQVVKDEPESKAELVRDSGEIQKLIERIDGLKPENVTALLSAIQGFRQANAALSSQAPPDDRSETETPRREAQSLR